MGSGAWKKWNSRQKVTRCRGRRAISLNKKRVRDGPSHPLGQLLSRNGKRQVLATMRTNWTHTLPAGMHAGAAAVDDSLTKLDTE